MRRWFILYGGHVYLCIAFFLFLQALLFVRESARMETPERGFWFFVIAALTAFLALVFGMLSAAKYNTYRERFHLRALWRDEDTNPPGVRRTTGTEGSAVSEAHTANEEAS